jgi:formylglycine-generating enzyme required for sulfatase activity
MRRIRAGLCAAGALLYWPLFAVASCGGQGRGAESAPAQESGADIGQLVDASPTDAAEEPGSLVDCASTFAVSPDCVHPPVAKSCDGIWCRILKGCSVMGSPRCEPGRGAYDEDEVQIRLTHDFEIAAHETTQAEWEAAGFANHSVVDAGYADCNAPDCPVGNLTWFDALSYANRLSEEHQPPLPDCYRFVDCTGTPGDGMVCARAEPTAEAIYECTGYRLPTEAEWEYAARAGTRTPIYSGLLTSHPLLHCGHDPNLEAIAWYCENAGTTTHPAEGRAPNAWGLFDVMGNAQEWVTDVFDGLGYGSSPMVDPGGLLGVARERVTRGGVAGSTSEGCRSASRAFLDWAVRGPGLGFRVARSL